MIAEEGPRVEVPLDLVASFVISVGAQEAARATAGIEEARTSFIYGRGAPSFARLVNSALDDGFRVRGAPAVLVMSDRVRPRMGHVERAARLLESGYGVAATYRFAFFAIHRQAFRRIGWLDERFLGGGYEDCDYMLRACEADVAWYEAEEVPYVRAATDLSRWPTRSEGHWRAKWEQLPDGRRRRRMFEQTTTPDIVPTFPHVLMPWSRSTLLPGSANFSGIAR